MQAERWYLVDPADYRKLQVSSRAAATLYASQHGLVGAYEPEPGPTAHP